MDNDKVRKIKELLTEIEMIAEGLPKKISFKMLDDGYDDFYREHLCKPKYLLMNGREIDWYKFVQYDPKVQMYRGIRILLTPELKRFEYV